ncbi:MAG: hypothetical protein PHW13_07560 [Methylococcales bacterium]|nr:hypothetical protein [Methylococcales bacterium]
MTGRTLAAILIPIVLGCFSRNALAALTDNGDGLVYDSVLNITWTAQNGNLFQSMAGGNANLVNDIMAASGGVIHDNPADTESNGGYTLSTSDFDAAKGTMDWWGAEAWITYLDSIRYDGYSDWRLPVTGNPVAGYNQTGSEMGELYYTALGLTAGSGIGGGNPYYGLFDNLSIYWSASEYSADYTQAWYFNALTGDQNSSLKDTQMAALAVLPGNAIVAPAPGAAWLFLSGLGLLSALAGRLRPSA